MSANNLPPRDLAVNNLAVKNRLVADEIVARKLMVSDANTNVSVPLVPAAGWTISGMDSAVSGRLVSVAAKMHADASVVLGFPPSEIATVSPAFAPNVKTTAVTVLESIPAILLSTIDTTGSITTFNPNGATAGPFDLCLSMIYLK